MLLGLFAAFCWSANRRWQLLKVGRPIDRLDNLFGKEGPHDKGRGAGILELPCASRIIRQR